MKIMEQNFLDDILTREGLSQTLLATRIEMSAGYINKICRNKAVPSERTKHRILNGLNGITKKDFKYEEIFSRGERNEIR